MAITHTNHANANTNGNTSQAVMSLTFTAKAGRTVLGHRTHQGGLALQKPLYPERHRHICHALVLYTPAGIVQGDELTMNFVLKANTHAVLTTTGAGKWYGLGQQVGDDNRHDGVNAGRGDRAIHSAHHTNNAEDTDNPSHANSHAKPAYQHIIAHVADGAVLEWLPQESIYYRRACADSVNRFYVADTAGLITWDMGVLGRRAFGECFDVGRIYNAWQIWRNDTLLMYDCIDEMAGSGWFDGMLGLGGQSVFGTLYAVPSLARIHLPIGQPNTTQADTTQADTADTNLYHDGISQSDIKHTAHTPWQNTKNDDVQNEPLQTHHTQNHNAKNHSAKNHDTQNLSISSQSHAKTAWRMAQFLDDSVNELRALCTSLDLPLVITHNYQVLSVRYVGDDVRACFEALYHVREWLRWHWFGISPHRPRIWDT